MRKRYLLLSLLTFLLITLNFGGAVQALEIKYPTLPSGTSLSEASGLEDLVRYLFELALIFALNICLILLIWAGFKYVSSLGNPARVIEAKDQLFSAFLGALIIFSAYLLLNSINPHILEKPGQIPELYFNPETFVFPEKELKSYNFQQIPVGYLIANRFLGIDSQGNEIDNDPFDHNRLKNILSVANYTKQIAEKINDLAKDLKDKVNACSCNHATLDNNCSTGNCDDHRSCTNKCGCYGEPCPNREKIRQLQTDLQWLTNAFSCYLDKDCWVAKWIEDNEDCFQKNKCKSWPKKSDCNPRNNDACYTWHKQTKGLSSDIKNFIIQIANQEQEYGDPGQILDELKNQKKELEKARIGVFSSKYYLGRAPFGYYWYESYYSFFRSAYEERLKVLKLNFQPWTEQNYKLLENNKDNQDKCENDFGGTWEEIAKNSKKAICNYNLEIQTPGPTKNLISPEPTNDLIRDWVIFYQSINNPSETSFLKQKWSGLVAEIKAQSLACEPQSSTEVPIIEAINTAIDFNDKLIAELEKFINYNEEIINNAEALFDLPDQCLGSKCSSSMSIERDCCGYCTECSGSGKNKSCSTWCCGGNYCSWCSCSACSSSNSNSVPCPFKTIKTKQKNISTYIQNDNCQDCDLTDSIDNLDNLINQPQEGLDNKTYKEFIMEKLKTTAQLFSDPEYGNNFPNDNINFQNWQEGKFQIPYLIDADMAYRYGINKENWNKLLKNPLNLYLCLPYILK